MNNFKPLGVPTLVAVLLMATLPAWSQNAAAQSAPQTNVDPYAAVPLTQAPVQQPYLPATSQPVQQQAVQQQAIQQQATPGYSPYATNPTSTPPMANPDNLPPMPSAFELGAQQNLGMTPSEIRQLRSMLENRQKAAAELPNPPKSVTGSVSVSLDPGATPPIVRPYFGMSTSIVVVDSTGAPWPVENFANGNASLVAINRLDGPTGSSFVISPLANFGQSNLILKLVGMPSPVVINILVGQKIHDARVEARVLARGPNAQSNAVSLVAAPDSRLNSVLDGVPPQGRTLTVKGDERSRAWLMPDGHIWLRTTVSIVSPAPISFANAADGTTVYALPATAKILGMINNQFVTLGIEGCLQECSSTPTTNQQW